MAAKRRAYARKITRKQALSYERLRPNKLGVTTIAVVNGPDAYDRRYAQTRALLKPNREERMAYTAKQTRALKKMSAAQKRTFKKMLARAPAIGRVRKGRRKARRNAGYSRNRAAPTKAAFIEAQLEGGASPKQAQARWKFKQMTIAARVMTGAPKKKRAVKKKRKAAPRKRRAPARKKATRKRTKRKAAPKRRRAPARKTKARKKAAPKRGRQQRTYGKGKYKALKSRVGGASYWSYMYRTKRGGTRHIPTHAALGYRTLREEMAAMKGSERHQVALAKRLTKLERRRTRAAETARKQIMRGRGRYAMFAPNPGDEALTFEEWKEMKPNRQTRKQRTASLKNLKKARAAKKRKSRGGTKRKSAAKRKTTSRRKTRRKRTKRLSATTKKRISRALKAYHRTCRKKAAGGKRRKPRKSAKRKSAKRKYKRNPARRGGQTAAQRRASLANLRKARAARSGGGGRGYSRNKMMSPAQRRASLSNLKKARSALARKRGYSFTRNQALAEGAGYTENLMGAMRIGIIVTGGYMVHRGLTSLLDTNALAKMDMFNKGALAEWRGTIASAVMAAILVPAAVAFSGEYAAPAGAGIAASFLHGLIIKALDAAKQPKIAAMLSGYTNAEGSVYYGSGMQGMGSYYSFSPGQVYGANGLGEYYEVTPGGQLLTTGELTQAAAGMGQPLLTGQLTQAAAGMGAIVTQAAAGQGQYSAGGGGAVVTQAAAGEYIVYGAAGMGGNYEEVPTAPMPTYVDQGVMPNLNSAEQALNVIEAAAGVGQAEVPYQSTINPTMYDVDIPDTMEGMREGTFGTPGGIFGGPAM